MAPVEFKPSQRMGHARFEPGVGNRHIMKNPACILSVIFILGLTLVPSPARADTENGFTNKFVEVQNLCQTIKTRAELSKFFIEDTGGVAWPPDKPFPFQQHQIFKYRKDPFIFVDVDFSPSDSKVARPADIILKISKPYYDDRPEV